MSKNMNLIGFTKKEWQLTHFSETASQQKIWCKGESRGHPDKTTCMFTGEPSEKLGSWGVAEAKHQWELGQSDLPSTATHIPVNVYPAYATISNRGASPPPSEKIETFNSIISENQPIILVTNFQFKASGVNLAWNWNCKYDHTQTGIYCC